MSRNAGSSTPPPHIHALATCVHGTTAAGEYQRTEWCQCGAQRRIVHRRQPNGMYLIDATPWSER